MRGIELKILFLNGSKKREAYTLTFNALMLLFGSLLGSLLGVLLGLSKDLKEISTIAVQVIRLFIYIFLVVFSFDYFILKRYVLFQRNRYSRLIQLLRLYLIECL